ncbi:MAG: hypothetical protein K5767_01205 [Clostridia bacterium]|nr:hypothetical protein [Clostridia bacterium]
MEYDRELAKYIEYVTERSEKRARNLALKGCYIDGNLPKKQVVDEYKKTDEYLNSVGMILSKNEIYQAALSSDPLSDKGFYNSYMDYRRRNGEPTEARLTPEEALSYIGGTDPDLLAPPDDEGLLSLLTVLFEKRMTEGKLFEKKSRGRRGKGSSYVLERRIRNMMERFADSHERLEIVTDQLLRIPRSGETRILKLIRHNTDGDRTLRMLLSDRVYGAEYRRFLVEHIIYTGQITKVLADRYDVTGAGELLQKNRRYTVAARALLAEIREREHLSRLMIDSIPDDPVDLYPAARTMNRRFILHIGPTNSGKTYQAIEALKKADRGVYLAPLRLLAYEKFEELNSAGKPCSLMTGEERILVPDAEIMSSTVEMMDEIAHYNVAVIDEGQMIADPERGGSWTRAVIGICADEIHICAAAHAEKVLIKLIEACGDTYSVVRHHRQIPLLFEEERFHFPESVRDGDALIVFSKKNVHAVATELQAEGIRCSIIYGDLPYDVRHEEARRFSEKETQVIVSTDAIGMGLNMPIRRVVFLESQKFDGKTRRPLESGEIQQIAGRAGRFGIYDKGFVNAAVDSLMIEKKLSRNISDIEKAVIKFPEALIHIDSRLSDILKRWDAIRLKEGFQRASLSSEIKLCEMIEDETDNKEFIYRAITIPFDERKEDLIRLWLDLVRTELAGMTVPFDAVRPEVDLTDLTYDDLQKLESAYRICDLMFSWDERFEHEEDINDIMEMKRMISRGIMKILSEQIMEGSRTCIRCGRKLMWNFPYRICDDCHRTLQKMGVNRRFRK